MPELPPANATMEQLRAFEAEENAKQRDRARATASRLFEECRESYEAGNPVALRNCLTYACLAEVALPQWAADAILRAFQQRVGSWNDLFGPIRRGRPNHPQHEELLRQVKMLVDAYVGQGRAIDEGLFSDVARDVGLGEDRHAKARTLYYEAKRSIFNEF